MAQAIFVILLNINHKRDTYNPFYRRLPFLKNRLYNLYYVNLSLLCNPRFNKFLIENLCFDFI